MNAQYQRALILHQQGRFADAERELRGVLGIEPHFAVGHAMLGLCLAVRQELIEASAEAEAAVGLAPDEPFAHYVRAKVLHRRNRDQEAEAAIDEAIRLDPRNPTYFALLAACRFDLRRWQDALDAADQGLAEDPDHRGCINLRAMALVKIGRKDQAGAFIRDALAKDPHNATTHANQGWTLLHQGDHRQALEHFREALRLDPTLEWARSGMVEALQARHLVYRIMLRYFLWMGRLSRRLQWGIIIGAYVAIQLLRGAGEQYPAFKPFVFPLLALYMLFAFLTWTAPSLFNLLLRLSRFGRYALSRDQTISSNLVGATLLLSLLAFGGFFLTANAIWLLAGSPRWIMAAYTAALAGIGAAFLICIEVMPSEPGGLPAAVEMLRNVFVLGLLCSGFVANGLMMKRVRR